MLVIPRLIQPSQPNIQIFNLLVDYILELAFLHNEIVDRTHQKREKSNSNKFNRHLEQVLVVCTSLEISVADSREGGDDPIDGNDVQAPDIIFAEGFNSLWDKCSIIFLKHNSIGARASRVHPRARILNSDEAPRARQDVDNKDQVQYQFEEIEDSLYQLFVQTHSIKHFLQHVVYMAQ